jgi:hypothetical protein
MTSVGNTLIKFFSISWPLYLETSVSVKCDKHFSVRHPCSKSIYIKFLKNFEINLKKIVQIFTHENK